MKMTKLTEDMIIARTKSSELGAVKKLNCWGSDLIDVSLVKRLANVEVLSLSLNKITTLSDFQYCRNLVELYIRRNAIRDLSELCYLQELTRLRRLLLAENPCVDTAGPLYRATVIRCLPNLEVLDNNEVTPDEVEQAMKVGLILEHPLARRERGSPEPIYYREESPPTAVVPNRRYSSALDCEQVIVKTSALARSPPSEYTPAYIHQPEDNKERRSPEESPQHSSPPQVNGTSNGLRHRRHSHQSSGNLIDDVNSSPPTTTNNNTINSAVDPPVVMRKVQRSPVQEYYPHTANAVQQHRDSIERDSRPAEMIITNGSSGGGGGNYHQQQQRRPSSDYLQDSGRGSYQEPYYDDSPPPQIRNSGSNQRGYTSAQNNSRGGSGSNNKPRTKTSNLLSAVLCLIPELDWASLEVVELAVRRRMDEFVSD
ncbi:uncharacterized protein LOC110848761 isoform X2 [Folsomia candida]|uniref:Protein tilB n=1 Tax=Folsomia candida TaxID=158441 RepID=A0A226EF17_FOLCA|nr:uncharacterized protein LOC110848761 isoform X2 [Folsomia candida]OXA55674.1 Protein tilB [Folsomia candida]